MQGRSRRGRASQGRRRCGSPDDDIPVPAYGGSVPDPTPPVALTIAGSDSGGGAGVQADLKTFAALHVHGTCALTAVTAQNTAEVRGVVALEPWFVRQQVETVLDDFAVRGVKTGMLATADIVMTVADLAEQAASPTWWWTRSWCRPPATACWSPPACRRTWDGSSPCAGGHPEPARGGRARGHDADSLRTLEARVAVARAIRTTGARYVVVKGGHLTESADDVVAGPDGASVLPGTRVATGNDHGTGCSLSAAVAANLARGLGARRDHAGEGLRGPRPGRERRLAPRIRTRAPRPFRVVHPAVGLAGHDAAPHRQ